MGIIDDIKDTVMGWINAALNIARSYAYELYDHVWNYASQIADDLWKETALIWARVGEIPVLTKDVIKGWVTPWINSAKDYALDLVNDVIDVFDAIIDDIDVAISYLQEWKEDVVDVKLSEFSTWITNASGWFSVQLDRSQDKIVKYIIDKFEYILDQVFKEEEE